MSDLRETVLNESMKGTMRIALRFVEMMPQKHFMLLLDVITAINKVEG